MENAKNKNSLHGKKTIKEKYVEEKKRQNENRKTKQ